jgi:hypothetical protein
MTPNQRNALGMVIAEMRFAVDNLDDVVDAMGSVPNAIRDWIDRLLYDVMGEPRPIGVDELWDRSLADSQRDPPDG